ncbi:MAG: (d)CMP kinase [Candidatus Omnitrophota bacterium]
MKEYFIVAIDGPAGAGKSTIARLVAERLNFIYVDTGAMYRALTLKAIRENVDLTDSTRLRTLMDKTNIDLQSSHGKNSLRVLLDNEEVTAEIRLPEITNKVFYIAQDASVRKKMVELQRRLAQKYKKAVLEGRDIGTVVFPKADVKIFLDAQVRERANRRFKELSEKGINVVLEEIEQDIIERDRKDKTREIGPLKQACDAVYVDSTNFSIEETVEKVTQIIKNDL